MKTYKNLIAEISGTLVKNYLEKAGGALKTMVQAPNKQELLPKIIKRSKGIKLAKAQLAKQTASHSIPDFSPKLQYIYDHYKEAIQLALSRDLTVGRLSLLRQHQTPEEFVRVMAKYDPTGNKHDYTEWLVHSYAKGWWQMEDMKKIYDLLKEFEAARPQLANKDINSYKTLNDLYDAVESTTPQLSKNATIELTKKAGTTVLVDNPEMKLLKLNNMGAVKQYCKGTRWCFSSDYETFKEYKGGLYLVITKIDDKIRKFAFHAKSGQFMDERDNEISNKDLKALLSKPGFDKIKKLYFNVSADENYNEEDTRLSRLVRLVLASGHRDLKLEAEIRDGLEHHPTSNAYMEANLALQEYIEILKERVSALEPYIAKDDDHSVYYAKNVIRGRFKPGEQIIIANRHNIWDYINDVIKGPWPAAETRFINFAKPYHDYSGYHSMYHADDLLSYFVKYAKRRMPKSVELHILSPEFREAYARHYANRGSGKMYENFMKLRRKYEAMFKVTYKDL